jgi:hypothetical protein
VSEQILVPAMMALATAVVGVLCLLIKKLGDAAAVYLDSKLGSDKRAELEKSALITVRYLEQSPAAKDLVNEKKKELLLISLQAEAKKLGIDISFEALDKIAEAAVHEVKSQFPWVAGEALELTTYDIPLQTAESK